MLLMSTDWRLKMKTSKPRLMTLKREMYISMIAASDFENSTPRSPKHAAVASVYDSAYGALYALDECFGAMTA